MLTVGLKKNRSIFALLVDCRTLFLVVVMLLAVLCGVMIPRVNINTDMTRYLPADSEMKKGIDRMTEALGADALNMLSVRAMYKGLSPRERDSLSSAFRQMEGVKALASVQEKEGCTLYDIVVSPDGDPKALAAHIRNGGHDVVVETSIDAYLPDPIVFIIAALLVFAILFLMCESWMEPLLFLATIGVAVVLNVGSNVLLPSVSMTTNAIVAILQLVLSIDYSIILMNRYRQELASDDGGDRVGAMKRALKAASPSVLSSAFTTMAGLLMLCFMKFRIGMDLGVVLAKGVLCSVICLYTVLPSLVLLFDKAIVRTHKRVFVPNTDRLARFEQRFRMPLALLAVILFGGTLYLHNLTPISFSTNWPTPISDVFSRKNTVVLLYQNSDEDKIIGLADLLSLDAKVDTVVSYPTLMRRQLNSEEMLATLSGLTSMLPPEASGMIDSMLTPELLDMVFMLRQHGASDNAPQSDQMDDIAEIVGIVENSSPAPMVSVTSGKASGKVVPVVSVAPAVHPDTLTVDAVIPPSEPSSDVLQSQPTYRDTILIPMSASAMAAYLGFESRQAAALYRMAGRAKGTMTPLEFVHYVCDKVLTNKMYASFISQDQKRQLLSLRHRMEEAFNASTPQIVEAVDTTQSLIHDTVAHTDTVYSVLSSDTIHAADTIIPSDNTAAVIREECFPPLVYTIPSESTEVPSSEPATCSLEELVGFLTEDLVNDPLFASFIDDSMRSHLSGVHDMMSEGVGQFKGDGWSMAAIVTDYADEGEETQAFLQRLRTCCNDALEGDYSLVGESVMFDEMRQGFGRELMLLTILTILAVLVIVALSFRSLVVPVILVLTVLTGVYINVFVSGLGGHTLLYLAYLIVQSILMGATIDYAILYSNYYREGRRTLPVGEALKKAYRGSIRTIMTSGLIIVLAPGIMSLLVEDRTISSIVGCIAVGGLSAIMLILFVLPACLAVCDPLIIKKTEA